jgi:hypothetical protein
MKDQVFRVEYFAISAEDRPGTGADLGRRLKAEGVNLIGVSAFPTTGGKTQVDLIPEHPDQLIKAAKKLNLTLSSPKVAFVVQGVDQVGAMGEVLGRLGAASINIRATTGIAAGGNRYGAMLWVAPADVDQATRALGAVTMATHHV